MNFNDLNEVMKLTYKADFIKTINQDPSSIKVCFCELRDQGMMTFEEAFDMIIKYIETRKMTITDKVKNKTKNNAISMLICFFIIK